MRTGQVLRYGVIYARTDSFHHNGKLKMELQISNGNQNVIFMISSIKNNYLTYCIKANLPWNKTMTEWSSTLLGMIVSRCTAL